MKKETTTFGFGQIGNHTPSWATWIFRVLLWIFSFATLAINTLNVSRLGLNDLDVKDTTALLALLILGAHSLSRMVGVEVKKEDYEIS